MDTAAGEAHELTIALDDGSHRQGVDAATVNDGCRLDTYLHLPPSTRRIAAQNCVETVKVAPKRGKTATFTVHIETHSVAESR